MAYIYRNKHVQPSQIRSLRQHLTLLSLVTAQTMLVPTATCMAPISGLGHSTTAHEVPAPQEILLSAKKHNHTHTHNILEPAFTFGAVSADALSDY